MATLAVDTPQTYQGSNIEVESVAVAGATFFLGSTLIEDTVAGKVIKYASGTSGFAGLSMAGAVLNDRVDIKEQGFWYGTIGATVAAADKGAVVYALATSDNPADWTTTSGSNLPVGRVHHVEVAGAAGTNRVVVFFQADSLRSI